MISANGSPGRTIVWNGGWRAPQRSLPSVACPFFFSEAGAPAEAHSLARRARPPGNFCKGKGPRRDPVFTNPHRGRL